MKILVLSKEAWRDEQSGGNVLSNLFKDFDAEFAQIYCNEREPNNMLCKCYYQITDRMMVNSILGKGKAGRYLVYDDVPKTVVDGQESFSGAKRWAGEWVRIGRELAWWCGRWNEKEIVAFVKDFNPDIIFAPCYGNHYMQKLTRLVHRHMSVNIISYISDDFYTNKQLRFSIAYWLNHFLLRRHTRQIFKYYSLVYTMTDEQKEQCECDFRANMKVLRKCGQFDSCYEKDTVGSPIRFVFAGGIYLNRWKTLGLLAEAMREVNKDGVKMILDIYTNNPLTAEMEKAINDGKTAKVHPVVSMAELRDIYHQSDVALHVEGFDITNRLTVRMSFSGKIVDCLDSGCAVMAICDKKQAGFAYLKRNDAAICISSKFDILLALKNILRNPGILIDYQHKAFELGRKNHLQVNVDKMIKDDFQSYLKRS